MIPSERTEQVAVFPAGSDRAPFLRGTGGMFAPLLNFFSSIWLGVILLSLLFIYSSIGSSGVPTHPWIFDPAHWKSVRQMRIFEMTDLEWFTWWPFDLLIALICTNVIVATLKRIPFDKLHFGVWMIHTGILTLAAGSLWYFSTKVEGEAPVLRRQLVIDAPDAQRVTLPVNPGAATAIGQGDNRYVLQVMSIDPRWELLSGDEKGQRAYKVSVMVQGKAGTFVRDLVANRPQYTQDLIMTGDQNQPMQRAIKALGKPLVDEALKISLDYQPQQWFYLMNSRALYLREVGSRNWVQRPIPQGRRGLPRYNDHIASADDVWLPAGEKIADVEGIDAIDVAVPPSEANDPLPGVTLHVSRYLQYAALETKHPIDPAAPINPRVSLTITAQTGQEQQYDLAAFDPQASSDLQGNLLFMWAASAEQIERMKVRVDPVIHFSFPASGKVVDETVTATLSADANLAFKPIEGTDYSYRVENLQDNLNFGGSPVSVAIVQIKSPMRTFTRWVFDDPKLNRDMAMTDEATAQHNAAIEKDVNIESVYRKGTFPPAPIVIVAGPGENDLAVMVTKATGQPVYTAVKPGDSVDIVKPVKLRIDRYAPRTRSETRPRLIADEQRDRQMGDMLSMVCVNLPSSFGTKDALWLPYHHFTFASADETLHRFAYQPTTITLPDGRQIEMMFGRRRLPLPAPVALDDFVVATHIGGFTGQNSSIMDWESLIRFQGEDGQWLSDQSVRVNQPTEFHGYWLFQAQWDPPEPPRSADAIPYSGLNYTILGVGNRNGVHVMLVGCIIAVCGMIYNFYGKPLIKRRRQQKVYNEMREATASADEVNSQIAQAEPVGAAWRAQT